MPDQGMLADVYDERYFSNSTFFAGENEAIYGYYDYLAERFNRQVSYRTTIERIVSLLDRDPREASLLDVGCGLGYLMDCAHDSGFAVSGVEFNAAAAAQLRQKYVFPVHVGDMQSYTGRTHDVITMMDVIEHLRDPVQIIRQIRRSLTDDGLLVMTTMDCDSPMSRILGPRLEDFRRVREHLYFFTRQSIRRLLCHEGFEVMSIRYHGHTFRLDFLAERCALISPILGAVARVVIKTLRLGSIHIHLNPGTKMIIFARKKTDGANQGAPQQTNVSTDTADELRVGKQDSATTEPAWRAQAGLTPGQ
ncbi:MAG: class I SAM-dependent methyltransferase [Candidatus Latescibacterota bacterium]|nr:class I SAM-dependent methyltransferase [Candidatus Latescibacterota bacterium]